MTNILSKFSHPFPFEYFSKNLILRFLTIGLFVGGFLYLFRPFGLHGAGKDTLFLCAMFGLITFISSIIVHTMTEHIVTSEKLKIEWKLWHWLIHTLCLVLFIAISNYLFMLSYLGASFTWQGLQWMAGSTLLIAVFPVGFLGITLLNKGESKDGAIAKDIKIVRHNKPSQKTIEGIPSSDIIFVESMQNYVKIYFINKNNQPSNEVIRTTMKSIEDQCTDTTLIRCHRSFIVNKDMVLSASGNAQGLKLSMKYIDEMVNVSRSYVETFRDF